MTFDFSNTRIFIKPGFIDFRTSKDRIIMTIENVMKQDPTSGAVFLFCNSCRMHLKLVWWDKNGFWVADKKLEKGRWPWPETQKEVQALSQTEVSLFLSGVDVFHRHEEIIIKK